MSLLFSNRKLWTHDRGLGTHASLTPPGSQASSRGEAKDSALLSSRDAGLLEPPERPQGSPASSSVWREDTGSIPGLGRSPGGGNGNPLKYSYLGNPRDRGAWWATDHRAAKESDIMTHLLKMSSLPSHVTADFRVPLNSPFHGIFANAPPYSQCSVWITAFTSIYFGYLLSSDHL